MREVLLPELERHIGSSADPMLSEDVHSRVDDVEIGALCYCSPTILPVPGDFVSFEDRLRGKWSLSSGGAAATRLHSGPQPSIWSIDLFFKSC